jgi:hypothetical protein
LGEPVEVVKLKGRFWKAAEFQSYLPEIIRWFTTGNASRLDQGRLPVPGHRPGCLQPPRDRLGDGPVS